MLSKQLIKDYSILHLMRQKFIFLHKWPKITEFEFKIIYKFLKSFMIYFFEKPTVFRLIWQKKKRLDAENVGNYIRKSRASPLNFHLKYNAF